jgi:hypothetical protein
MIVLDKLIETQSLVSVRNLPAGNYIARIHIDREVFWQKLVVEH